MLGFFPNPYPDELFYGILARLYRIMASPSSDSFSRLLFGEIKLNPGILIAKHLDPLIKQLPPSHPVTGEEIKWDHTILAFYTAFLEKPLREDRLNEPVDIFSCPICRKEDEKKQGEAYWHRSHQIPFGVVCHKHGKPLQRSIKKWKPGRSINVVYFRPKDTEWEELPPISAKEQAIYARFHDRVQKILMEGIKLAPDHRKTLEAACHRQGFYKGNNLNRDKLLAFIEVNIGRVAKTLFQLPNEPKVAREILTNVIAGREPNPHRHLLFYEILNLNIRETVEMPPKPVPPTRRKKAKPLKKMARTQARHRAAFLKLLKKFPNATRGELTKLRPDTEKWLRKNDRAWMVAQKGFPPMARRQTYDLLKDRDPLAAELVEKAVAIAKTITGRPIRITANSLAPLLPEKEGKNLLACRNFPLTKKALKLNSDSEISLAEKRIEWGLKQIQGKHARWRDFCNIAGLRAMVDTDAKIREMAKKAYTSRT